MQIYFNIRKIPPLNKQKKNIHAYTINMHRFTLNMHKMVLLQIIPYTKQTACNKVNKHNNNKMA